MTERDNAERELAQRVEAPEGDVAVAVIREGRNRWGFGVAQNSRDRVAEEGARQPVELLCVACRKGRGGGREGRGGGGGIGGGGGGAGEAT
jgi:hypothetical protein